MVARRYVKTATFLSLALALVVGCESAREPEPPPSEEELNGALLGGADLGGGWVEVASSVEGPTPTEGESVQFCRPIPEEPAAAVYRAFNDPNRGSVLHWLQSYEVDAVAAFAAIRESFESCPDLMTPPEVLPFPHLGEETYAFAIELTGESELPSYYAVVRRGGVISLVGVVATTTLSVEDLERYARRADEKLVGVLEAQ